MDVRTAGELAGTYSIVCDRAELSLIAEGLYAVERAGRSCLRDDVPDEFDRPMLEAEVERLADMRTSLLAVLDGRPEFRVMDGGDGK